MSLTWLEISQRWPDCCVPWDRDVAPTLDWEVRFRERDGVLWADDVEERGQWFHHVTNCRCLVWLDGSWISHRAYGLLQMERMAAEIAAESPDPRRWWDLYNRDRVETGTGRVYIAGTPWGTGLLDEFYRAESRSTSHMADAVAYAAHHMWRTGHSALDEYREIARGRWPTLRRVLGRNAAPLLELEDEIARSRPAAPPTASASASPGHPVEPER